MSINMPNKQSGAGASRLMSLIQLGAGAATGDPFLIAGGVSGIQSANGVNSPATKALGVTKALGGSGGADVTQGVMPGNAMDTDSSPQGEAINRALDQKKQSPDYLIAQGLQHLNNPEIYNSMPHDDYMSLVEPLLRAKHYGMGGGLGGAGSSGMGNGGYA